MNGSVFEKGYWKQPEIANDQQGDRDADQIFCSVGRALAAWEGAEEQVSILFLVLSALPSERQALILFRAFGAIQSTEGKLSVLEAAAETFFREHWKRKEISGRFRNVVRAIRGASHRRNEIAHCRISDFNGFIITEPNNVFRRIDKGLFLTPPRYASMHNDVISERFTENVWNVTGSRYAYTSGIIEGFKRKFCQLATEITEYTQDLVPDEQGVPYCVNEMLKADAQKHGDREGVSQSRRKPTE